ncbi:hypothetical protein DLJ49_06260 [Rhodovulum sp. 12E13]|uniref:hypothetical protein n=1 Tax=Rhodovulum sp. 12E13 TaxID=2203891 RepID=UPI000E164CCC|nr:hypothetical protein [Rhodovulum sp. 12E13]RDC73717.1 hypothetical protein DLJ49_06260 [Rhodovulum sp. 12E13]
MNDIAKSQPSAASRGSARLVPDWRVHVGAHKTATTHFQALLSAARAQADAADVALLLQDRLRQPAVALRMCPKGWRGLRRRLRLRLRTVRRLRAAVEGAGRVAASEENFLGFPEDLLHGTFYPDLSGLDFVRRLAGPDRLSLYISIRGYDGLMASTLFELMRSTPDARARWEHGVALLVEGDGGWPDLMRRIERRVPGARLHFWCQERYAADPAGIVAAFLGVPVSNLPVLDKPGSTRSPAASALAEVETLDPGLPRQERIRRVGEIYARHPADGGPTLLSSGDADVLAARYERDVALLRARYPELGAP